MRKTKATILVGAVGAGVAYARSRAPQPLGPKNAASLVVNRPARELQPEPGVLAEPLRRLAEHATVEFAAAPGGRGTVVRAKSEDPGANVRDELRAAKQVLETGQVVAPDAWPAAREPSAQIVTEFLDRLMAKGGGR